MKILNIYITINFIFKLFTKITFILFITQEIKYFNSILCVIYESNYYTYYLLNKLPYSTEKKACVQQCDITD